MSKKIDAIVLNKDVVVSGATSQANSTIIGILQDKNIIISGMSTELVYRNYIAANLEFLLSFDQMSANLSEAARVDSCFQIEADAQLASIKNITQEEIDFVISGDLNGSISSTLALENNLSLQGDLNIVMITYRKMQDVYDLNMEDIYDWDMDVLYMTTVD